MHDSKYEIKYLKLFEIKYLKLNVRSDLKLKWMMKTMLFFVL